MNTVEFEVVGEEQLHCVACETRVARSLERLPGIQAVKASAKTQRISIWFNAAVVDEASLGEKLAELGYVVQPSRRTDIRALARRTP